MRKTSFAGGGSQKDFQWEEVHTEAVGFERDTWGLWKGLTIVEGAEHWETPQRQGSFCL